jgi:hypothetical protein
LASTAIKSLITCLFLAVLQTLYPTFKIKDPEEKAKPFASAINPLITCLLLAVLQTLYPSFKIKDPEEKVKARQELLAGPLADKLKLLSKAVVSWSGAAAVQIRAQFRTCPA